MSDIEQNTQEQVKSIHKTSSLDFAGIDEIPNPRIDENVFVRDFLKLMLEPDLPEEVIQAHNLKWIYHTKNVFTPMDVIRGGRQYNGTINGGEYLYTVPPLFDNSVDTISAAARKEDSFKTLMYNVDQQRKIAQHFGDEVLNKFLTSLINKETKVSPILAARWMHIFEFYGITERVVQTQTGKEYSASTVTGAVSHDAQSYDEDEDA